MVWLALALPLPRLLLRRGDALDALLVALRLALLAALRAAPTARAALPFWLSPLADLPVAVRLTWSVLRPRGRGGAGPTPEEEQQRR